jgi:hypothetical protein
MDAKASVARASGERQGTAASAACENSTQANTSDEMTLRRQRECSHWITDPASASLDTA